LTHAHDQPISLPKPQHVLRHSWAAWQSGYAADCKSVYLGSTPGAASTLEVFLIILMLYGLFIRLTYKNEGLTS
jgi:hypothetical protein